MRTTPTLFKRITLASAAAITTLALSTGCTISFDGSTGSDEATPAPDTQQQPGEEPRDDAAPNDDAQPDTNGDPAEGTDPAEGSDGQGAEGEVPPGASSAPVPPGTSLKAIYEHEVSGTLNDTGYAQVNGVFTVDVDSPVMINFDVEILDSSGNLITSGEGLNTMYTTGRSSLVTRNLVEVDEQDRDDVHSFRMRITEVTEMRDAPAFDLSHPERGEAEFGPAVTGTWEVVSPGTRKLSAVAVTAACVDTDGQVFVGEQSIDPYAADSGTYEVPLHDLNFQDERDIADMTCYSSI